MSMKKIALALLVAGLGLGALVPGASAAQSYTVKTTLDGRTVKDPNVAVGKLRVPDKYPAGSQVSLVCQDTGPSYGGSTVWDLTSDGYWIPGAYVETGGVAQPHCVLPKSFPAKVDLNGRVHKGEPSSATGTVVDKYLAGASVPIQCQATAGGTIWDFTTDALWVPDEYVANAYVAGIPRCDTDGESAASTGEHGRNTGPAGPKTGTSAEKIARVIAAAKSMTGKGYNYAWGGGGKGGPSYGIHHYPDEDYTQGDDYERFGFDCSGLTLYAFWKGAGVDLGYWTGEQYGAGTRVPVSQMKAGDLIFWGDGDDSESTHHVALYLGGNQLIESAPPRDGKSVHIRTLYGQTEWMDHVIRVFP